MIWRHLATKGIAYDIIAPSSIPKRAGDRVKTDRRDALMLSRSGELTPRLLGATRRRSPVSGRLWQKQVPTTVAFVHHQF